MSSYTVSTYLSAGVVFDQYALGVTKAREMGARIVREGLWVTDIQGETPGTELFYPTDKITKVKIFPTPDQYSGKCLENMKKTNELLGNIVGACTKDAHARAEGLK